MAGEILKTRGVVLQISPWSQTSHIVTWLTPNGVVSTAVKGAERPKSMFLGQYDLYYTCELLYYARARGDVHAIREVVPRNCRDGLRGRWRETALAGYAAFLAARLAPSGPDAAGWFDRLNDYLDSLAAPPLEAEAAEERTRRLLSSLLAFDLSVLSLAGLTPDFSQYDPREPWQPFSVDLGRYGEGVRTVRIPRSVGACLVKPEKSRNLNFVLDALRLLGVFYAFHLDLPAEVRRSVIRMVTTTEGDQSP